MTTHFCNNGKKTKKTKKKEEMNNIWASKGARIKCPVNFGIESSVGLSIDCTKPQFSLPAKVKQKKTKTREAILTFWFIHLHVLRIQANMFYCSVPMQSNDHRIISHVFRHSFSFLILFFVSFMICRLAFACNLILLAHKIHSFACIAAAISFAAHQKRTFSKIKEKIPTDHNFKF